MNAIVLTNSELQGRLSSSTLMIGGYKVFCRVVVIELPYIVYPNNHGTDKDITLMTELKCHVLPADTGSSELPKKHAWLLYQSKDTGKPLRTI